MSLNWHKDISSFILAHISRLQHLAVSKWPYMRIKYKKDLRLPKRTDIITSITWTARFLCICRDYGLHSDNQSPDDPYFTLWSSSLGNIVCLLSLFWVWSPGDWPLVMQLGSQAGMAIVKLSRQAFALYRQLVDPASHNIFSKAS